MKRTVTISLFFRRKDRKIAKQTPICVRGKLLHSFLFVVVKKEKGGDFAWFPDRFMCVEGYFLLSGSSEHQLHYGESKECWDGHKRDLRYLGSCRLRCLGFYFNGHVIQEHSASTVLVELRVEHEILHPCSDAVEVLPREQRHIDYFVK